MSNFHDVTRFHLKFGLGDGSQSFSPGPREVPPELLKFRQKFLVEELDEFMEGMEEKDDAKMADALVDIVYVAMGTALVLGYPWEELWDEVQRANMKKARAREASESKRGSVWDVIKPDGWKTPDIMGILRKYGFVK